MITRIKTNQEFRYENGVIGDVIELYGLSTDTKPTDVPNATCLYEMDKVDGKNRIWMFDEQNEEWILQNG